MNYKQINKELVEKVQEMKIQLNLYCNEIVSLKRDLMHKHEDQMFLRKKCFYWAVDNFKNIIETVEPESSIIERIREYQPKTEDLSSMNRNSYQQNHRSVNSLSSSNEQRRSVQLREELQRSNNVIHSRKSLCCTSPVRHSSRARNLESEIVAEIEQPDLPTELESLQQVNMDNIIFEESDEEIEELESEYELETTSQNQKTNATASQTLQQNIETICNESEATAEEDANYSSDYESVEEIVSDISYTKTSNVEISLNNGAEDISKKMIPSRTLLGDLTNSNNSLQKVTQKRKYDRSAIRRTQNRKQHLTSNNESHESTDSSPAFNRDRQRPSKISDKTTRKQDKARLTDISPKSMDVEESLQEQREILGNKSNAARRKSIHIPQIIEQEVSMTTSFAVNDSTLHNFNQAVASSTPNSIRKVIGQTISESPPLSSSNNSRPSRKCKPKVLAEPKLGTKMRNETEESFPVKKNRKKTKTKTN